MDNWKKVNSALIVYDPEHAPVRKWALIDGRLYKEMSKESRLLLHGYEMEQKQLYNFSNPPTPPYIYNNKQVYRVYENNNTVVAENPNLKRDWKRDEREW